MLRKILLVVLMLSLFAFPTAALAVDVPRLIFSHFQCNGTEAAELHFVLQRFGETDLTGTFVEWTGELDGVPINGVAPWVPPVTGGVGHYSVNVPVLAGPHTFAILAAVIALPGWGPTTLSNPQTVQLEACAPLGVVIDAFAATCEPGGVRLEWSVSTELWSSRYTVTQDGALILDVPSDCPGCTASASYVRSVATTTPNGTYTLNVYNGDALTDTSETTLTGCNVPTAVTLTAFTARKPNRCLCEDGYYQCRIRGVWTPLWRCQ
jgi:hypothetical protein